MARKSFIERHKKPKKFKVREYNRCSVCGNPRGYMRKFKMCRKCFRELVHKGFLPGVKKSSW
ncbi:30S ribosomal protein S14 type Z [candidate division WWE3 bacterium RIFCSPHIGHO2_12_FULL_38_15]|uniref:Small ribosomal subunit protein uS14 n=1 Tax=candidate division WWE3 bacterium RIFCSPHIGHO2_02_FULL_38_14 TaxID=1802620 RepID=A0A1F4VBB7_UNCKA|nr:MAG: 30S ribosomal protein S14 type Z [candidate division WWE3 bacterium RIFCSPHIGHO2_01_FULL_38_45]OGC49088.1 MAG: 30S ribosomal protein S14 type Z [candidate division WWE3 bacterium RIFCSPHIGHO2_12_FULL_38_15]OGC53543.1 MAG: 30S ribosomal protein S14 type Z [candidate division WWE3 bacterium RIFCSPLOWO2_01_FULL_37_24]OGC54447.1 MAG: 30S ribosomal protein S14 type Z [candidate division WWE3 bacterium RIFCSPHIGHO2_02_FULL_38_14]HLB51693.1 type Z 30S ribosomal protein S14 [Patescibacteria gro